jgi:hypothetical protein
MIRGEFVDDHASDKAALLLMRDIIAAPELASSECHGDKRFENASITCRRRRDPGRATKQRLAWQARNADLRKRDHLSSRRAALRLLAIASTVASIFLRAVIQLIEPKTEGDPALCGCIHERGKCCTTTPTRITHTG